MITICLEHTLDCFNEPASLSGAPEKLQVNQFVTA